MEDGDGDEVCRQRCIRFTEPLAAIESIRSTKLRILTFVGFASADYEDHSLVEHAISDILAPLDSRLVVVCSGATEAGIGRVYPLAKYCGFPTIGIVSTLALAEGTHFSPAVQKIYLIEDEQWGGRTPNGILSPTSTVMVGAADEIVTIGGGDIARDEIEVAIATGKPVRYIAADMNHAAALRKAQLNGDVAPQDFKGSVHYLFSRD